MSIKKRKFKKFCDDCEKLFRPDGRVVRYCPRCMKKRINKRNEMVKKRWKRNSD